MAIYMIKCPSCGSATELNDEKDFCFCTECGKKILKEDAELFTPPPEPTPDAPAPRAEAAPVPAAEPEAAPDAPEDAPAPAEAPAPEPSEAPEPPLAIPAYEGPALTNAEHLEHLIASRPEPLDSVKFRSSDECAAYVSGLHDTILDLAARYGQMNHAEEATCLDYLDRGIAYCEVLDTRRLKFLAGTHEENGKTVEDYGTFPDRKSVV